MALAREARCVRLRNRIGWGPDISCYLAPRQGKAVKLLA